jgi:hypothetical protein
VEVDTTLPSLPPFFPPVLVETGSSEDETVSFPPFPPLPVGEGTAGEVEETVGDEAVDFRTSEAEIPLEEGGTTGEETALISFPPSVTVIWGRHVRNLLTVGLV